MIQVLDRVQTIQTSPNISKQKNPALCRKSQNTLRSDLQGKSPHINHAPRRCRGVPFPLCRWSQRHVAGCERWLQVPVPIMIWALGRDRARLPISGADWHHKTKASQVQHIWTYLGWFMRPSFWEKQSKSPWLGWAGRKVIGQIYALQTTKG